MDRLSTPSIGELISPSTLFLFHNRDKLTEEHISLLETQITNHQTILLTKYSGYKIQ